MIEIKDTKTNSARIVKMGRMNPLQVGVIVEGEAMPEQVGCYVMRTASSEDFEVINLSNPGTDKCWNFRSPIEVRLLGEGESVTLTLRNK